MRKFLRKLWNDKRGNALIIAAAALPLVVGSAGLATDTIQWTVWKRQLQRAADSAAYAGVYAKAQKASVDAAVASDLAKNHHAPASFLGGYPQIAYPNLAPYTDAVQVTLAIQKKLGFSSLFISQPPVITTSATAALIDDGEFCVVALEDSTAAGITIGGSSNSSLGCGAISNSIGDPSVSTNGVSYNFSATTVAGANTLPSSINGTSDLDPNHMAVTDPFKDLYPTDIPTSAIPCKNLNQNNIQPNQCYSNFKFAGNGTITLPAGVYYLNSTDFDVTGGATVKGTGVTIILTGSAPGSIKTNGNSTIQLTAPTSGTYEDMLFIQSSNATADNLNEINGSNTSKYDGAVYIPKGKVNFTGSTGATTKCVMVVAKKVEFSGNANLQNDVIGCDANKKIPLKVVRLVA